MSISYAATVTIVRLFMQNLQNSYQSKYIVQINYIIIWLNFFNSCNFSQIINNKLHRVRIICVEITDDVLKFSFKI